MTIPSFSSPDAILINVPHINFRESTNLFSFRSPLLQTPSPCIQLMNTLWRKYYLYEKFLFAQLWWIVSRIIFLDYTSENLVIFSSPDCNLVLLLEIFSKTLPLYNLCFVYVLLTTSLHIMYWGLQNVGMVTDGPKVGRLSLMNGQKCLIVIVISLSWSFICWWFWDIGAGLCFEMLK